MKENDTVMEVADFYGISIPALQLGTIQDYVDGVQHDKLLKINNLSIKHNSIGAYLYKNQLRFYFLINDDRMRFYNEIKDMVKCTLLKKAVTMERPIQDSGIPKA